MTRQLKERRNPLYLNANLIYSEALNCIKKESWKREIKSGTLAKLNIEGYNLVTSILTRMEVIQQLKWENNIPFTKSREIYKSILERYKILEITGINKHVLLNDPFIESIGSSNLDFKDALHLAIARKLGIPVCTHDKKILKNFSNHEEKSRFYDKVFKPQQLITTRK